MKAMRSKILALWLFTAIAVMAQAQMPSQFKGRWWLGMLEEVSLPLNITFEEDASGALEPVLYSPMQSAEAMRPTTWSYAGDTLRIQIKDIGAKMTLRYNAADSIFSGRFKQGLYVTDITLKPTQGLFKQNRPQEPQPPFPYSEQRLVLNHKDSHGEKIDVGVTLTMPDIKGQAVPCVLLVSGSGLQNRDEELLGHKPFLVIADYLARNGIASLRYDDRGTGESLGDVTNITTDDLAEDAEWLFNWLRKQPGIDPKRVGIAGHSEGGCIAAMIASHNRKVAFIVMLAGPGVDGGEILRMQNRDLYLADGVDSGLVAARDAFLKDCFDALPQHKDGELDSLFKAFADRHSKGLTKAERKKVGLTAYEASQMALQIQMQAAWMRRFIELDPADYLKKVRCPVLAMNGGKDLQVSAEENLAAINKSVKSELLTERRFEGLNHLFQHCDKGLPSEYMLIEETFAPEALEAMAEWIKATVR